MGQQPSGGPSSNKLVTALGVAMVLFSVYPCCFDCPDASASAAARTAPDVGGDDADFDVLAHIGGGLRFAFKSPLIPVDATIDGPTALEVGETGTYTAFVNDDASGPLSYMWDFGAGATADGLTASHAYSSPGTSTVSCSRSPGSG